MDKIIGSLIILSMLYATGDKINQVIIQSYLNNSKKIFNKDKLKNIKAEDIDDIISEISRTSLTINALLNKNEIEKNNLKFILNGLVISKVKFNDEQIDSFKKYNKNIFQEEINIEYFQKKLDDKKEFILLQNELIHKSNSLDLVYQKLNNILKFQINIINSLYNSIFNLKCCSELITNR